MRADRNSPRRLECYILRQFMVVPAAQKQKSFHGLVRLLATVGAFLLVACVNLTPPWDGVAAQGGAQADALAAGGALEVFDSASGGTAGATSPELDASGSGGAPWSTGGQVAPGAGGTADASAGGTQDLPSAGDGGAVSSGGTAGGSAGAAGWADSSVVSSGGSAGDASGRADFPAADGRRDAFESDVQSDAPVTDNGDAADLADSVGDTIEIGPSREDGAPDLPADLAPEPGPDAGPETADTDSVCNSAYFDAKDLGHTNGWAESDGWYLAGSGQFVYSNSISYLAVKTKITVVARGDLASNQWPTMEVSAGQSNIVGTASVSSSEMTAYSFTFDALTTYAGVGVTVTSGTGLHIQSITIGCP
jgi:hypothetical protein